VPSGASVQTPPQSLSCAINKDRAAVKEIPFGRRAIGEFTASRLSTRPPSDRTMLTPPRQSDATTSPVAVATTHSGRLRPEPTADNELGTTRVIDTKFVNVYGKPRAWSTFR